MHFSWNRYYPSGREQQQPGVPKAIWNQVCCWWLCVIRCMGIGNEECVQFIEMEMSSFDEIFATGYTGICHFVKKFLPVFPCEGIVPVLNLKHAPTRTPGACHFPTGYRREMCFFHTRAWYWNHRDKFWNIHVYMYICLNADLGKNTWWLRI